METIIIDKKDFNLDKLKQILTNNQKSFLWIKCGKKQVGRKLKVSDNLDKVYKELCYGINQVKTLSN